MRGARRRRRSSAAAHPLLAAAAASTPAHASGGSSTRRSRTWSRTTSFVPGTSRSPQEPRRGAAPSWSRRQPPARRARGAVREAAVLGEHALRLTPADSAERPSACSRSPTISSVAGEKQRLTDLLTAELEGSHPDRHACVPACSCPGASCAATTRSAASWSGRWWRARATRGVRAAVLWRTWRRTRP